MNLHYYCINCECFYTEDQIGDQEGITYCIWCDSEDLLVTGSERTPEYIIDSNPYSEHLVDYKNCGCEDYPCCGH